MGKRLGSQRERRGKDAQRRQNPTATPPALAHQAAGVDDFRPIIDHAVPRPVLIWDRIDPEQRRTPPSPPTDMQCRHPAAGHMIDRGKPALIAAHLRRELPGFAALSTGTAPVAARWQTTHRAYLRCNFFNTRQPSALTLFCSGQRPGRAGFSPILRSTPLNAWAAPSA